VVCPANAYVPGKQSTGSLSFVAHLLPAGHVLHALAEPNEYSPELHIVSDVASQ